MRARVALLIQHETHMRLIVSSFVAFLAPLHFSTLCYKRHNFRENVTEHKVPVKIFSTTFYWNIFYSKKNLAKYCHKCEKFFLKSTHYFLPILIELQFFRQIF